jgi:FkbM family methyltransferase
MLHEFQQRQGKSRVQLPWGLEIEIDAADTIGDALAGQSLYDIVTTEVLWRLTERGDNTVDVGANIGYMTSLLAVRAGPSGSVVSFEPHPETFQMLQRNVQGWSGLKQCASIALHRLAVSDCEGEAMLDLLEADVDNKSHAHLTFDSPHLGVLVQTSRLERFLDPNRSIGVMKIDAEGHQAAVLQSVGAHLRSNNIRDIVFEEETKFPAPSHRILQDAGYSLFWFEEHFRGPKIVPPDKQYRPKRPYDIMPSFLATLDPNRAQRLFSNSGWQSF